MPIALDINMQVTHNVGFCEIYSKFLLVKIQSLLKVLNLILIILYTAVVPRWLCAGVH